MGRGRAPCCDKNQVRRGPWSPAEDLRLITFIQKHGHENWRALPKLSGLKRCGKSCRLRWINYLRPDVKRGNFTNEEEDIIIKLHAALGNRWSKIASHLPGRTDNEIKNVWNTHLKKRALSLNNSDQPNNTKSNEILKELSSITSFSSSKKNITCSVSSYDSNNVSSNSSTEVDVSWAKDEMGLLFDQKLQEEVNKPDLLQLEADQDFWNMLDNLDPLQQPNEQLVQLREAKVQQSSTTFGEDYNTREVVENKKWFRYLENELGLENNANHQQLFEADHNKTEELVSRETFHYDPTMANYYHLLPSSPRQFEY